MSDFEYLEELRTLRLFRELTVCTRQSVVSSTFDLLKRQNLVLGFWSVVHDGRNILLQCFRKIFLVRHIIWKQSLR